MNKIYNEYAMNKVYNEIFEKNLKTNKKDRILA
jgi:hypothetical protein